ncbi:MAG: hypothetical protein U5K79_01630 [Cyclobacteriaceae bacterium]|nr:hypothetical protein [Cyclobacteriaceae bacterium]
MVKQVKQTKSVQSLHPCKSVIQTSYDIVTKGHNGTLRGRYDRRCGLPCRGRGYFQLPLSTTDLSDYTNTVKMTRIKIKDDGDGFKQIMKSLHPCKSVIQTSYDIITKGHNGTLEVDTTEGEGLPAGQAGTEFIVQLPIQHN